MNLIEDIVHRITNRTGHGAVDRRCSRLVFQSPCIGDDASGRYGAAAQRPQKFLVKLFAPRFDFDTRQGFRDPFVGIINRLVDLATVFGGQSILRVPNID